MGNSTLARDRILALLRGQRAAPPPCFSVLSSITAPALAVRGLLFPRVHRAAGAMVRASAAPVELYGWRSAILPTDLCVEAEAFGALVDFRDDMPEAMWPFVPHPPFRSLDEIRMPPGDFSKRGRIPLICEALTQLRERLKGEAVVGAFVPGPFTLALYVTDYNALLMAVASAPEAVARALDILTDALIPVATAYVNAGAELLTVHEMGGSPGVIGPRAFEALVLPRLQRLLRAIPPPHVLSVCGNTNHAVPLLAEAGASALHVDQTNDLARTRAILGPGAVLLGNLDPVRVLAHGTPDAIRAAAEQAARAGADAVMPGCDLYLTTPPENTRALARATANLKR